MCAAGKPYASADPAANSLTAPKATFFIPSGPRSATKAASRGQGGKVVVQARALRRRSEALVHLQSPESTTTAVRLTFAFAAPIGANSAEAPASGPRSRTADASDQSR